MQEQREQREWKCLVCGKKFPVGQWTCSDGLSNHVVEDRIYRCCDAPSDPGYGPGGKPLEVSNYGQTRVCNIPPPQKVMEGNDVKMVGEGSVDFVRGRFSTTDPQKQYWLNKRPEYNRTEEEWQANWLSNSQRNELERLQLKAERERLENDRNELLASTKQRVGA